MEFLCFDSISQVSAASRGRAVLAASHGGAYVAGVALRLGLGGVILSDAGVGRERAGIAGLDLLDTHLVPAAAISAHSARIGDGSDCLARGVISFANAAAQGIGVTKGMPAREALQRMAGAPREPVGRIPMVEESRRRLQGASGIDVIAADSNSLVGPDDQRAIVVTGSHGALLGGRPETAVKWPVLAAIYNDAGLGIDGAGITRLPALDARGIAAATVSAWSARIGDAQSSLNDGFITHANVRAVTLGAEIGISCRELVVRLLEAASQPTSVRTNP
jgi:hypothetical protein